jgi:hypothetical protein
MTEIYNNFYLSWNRFKERCESRAKNRCIITNSCWKKLKRYHTEMFLQKIENPFAFLFYMRYIKKKEYYDNYLNHYYHKYLILRGESFEKTVRNP